MKDLYDYSLPKDFIAAVPAEPRHSSRLFVYDSARDSIELDTFLHVANFLPKSALLVLNDTKVVPARTFLYRSTGGRVEVFFLVSEWNGDVEAIPALINKGLSNGERLRTSDGAFVFEIVSKKGSIYMVKCIQGQFNLEFLNTYGETPIPHYIKGVKLDEKELRDRYQTVFADKPASVAAPTASLHFTPEVFERLEKAGIETAKIQLHVGLGTFAPLKEENIKEGKLHTEYFHISDESAAAIKAAKKTGIPIIAVGTTVVRALESWARGDKEATDIFIRPPFEFKIVDGLITNFHIPNSSLMMLVEAFLQYKKVPRHLIELYQQAIAEKFRFYSFGDSMLIK